MKFAQLALCFETIEKTASRNQMMVLLADCFAQANPTEAKIIAYLVLGTLLPSYQTSNFNIATKGLISILASWTGKSYEIMESQVKQVGDIGTVAHLCSTGVDVQLTVQEVYDALYACVRVQGIGSTEKKEQVIVELLNRVDALSAKYIMRIIEKTLRLGCSDMTILDALSWMYGQDKKVRPFVEHAYNVCADLGLVAYALKEYGLEYVKSIEPQVGIPIRPAAAERLATAHDIVEKLGPCVAQPKLDGFRLQIHVDKRTAHPQIHFYSRNLVDMSEMFPDIYSQLLGLPVEQLICEGEAIGYDESTGTFLPFQETVKRKRKHGIEESAQDIPLRVFLFDLLLYNGKSLLSDTHKQRRLLLNELVSTVQTSDLVVIEELYCTTGEELESYFLSCIQAGLEGLVVKREDAIYQPGKRNFNWIKLKRQTGQKLGDTIDCVILGYYAGRGKRAALNIGAFLVGVYNPELDRFESVAKVGTGMTDEEFKELWRMAQPYIVGGKPGNVYIAKELYPDVWLSPELVCVIRADDITKSPLHTAGSSADCLGYALRFPRFLSYRIDKSAFDVTASQELVSLYKLQFVS